MYVVVLQINSFGKRISLVMEDQEPVVPQPGQVALQLEQDPDAVVVVAEVHEEPQVQPQVLADDEADDEDSEVSLPPPPPGYLGPASGEVTCADWLVLVDVLLLHDRFVSRLFGQRASRRLTATRRTSTPSWRGTPWQP